MPILTSWSILSFHEHHCWCNSARLCIKCWHKMSGLACSDAACRLHLAVKAENSATSAVHQTQGPRSSALHVAISSESFELRISSTACILARNFACLSAPTQRAPRPDLCRETNEENKRDDKSSCAAQLQVWYATGKSPARLNFQCSECLFREFASCFLSGRMLCLFVVKQSAACFYLFSSIPPLWQCGLGLV